MVKEKWRGRMTSRELAWRIRRDGIEMTHLSHGSHIASILSVADIIAVLYIEILDVDAANPHKESRDRFILSKGHAGAAVYAALAECGFFDRKELATHYQNGSRLSGHISHIGIPGIEASTGSLGHGCCMAAGMALAAKMDGRTNMVYTVIGDGECDEGSVWEMALFANHNRLNNLVVIIDHNKMQSLDYCENTLELLDLGEKWRSFGWHVVETDGHNHEELAAGMKNTSKDKPTCVIAHTVKGKGISFMEGNILWHYRDPQGEWYEKALEELSAVCQKGWNGEDEA